MTLGRLHSVRDLEQLRGKLTSEFNPLKTVVTICSGTGCRACGCLPVAEAFRSEIDRERLENEVELKTTGCHGFCERGPLAVIEPQGIFYQRLKPADVKLLMDQTIKGGRIVHRLLYRDPGSGETITYAKDIPFYKKQMRLIFGKNGFMDPMSVDDYIRLGGYAPVVKAIMSMTPEQIISEVAKSGLRGRGGGGFPTGKKWAWCRRAGGNVKYVICNADEGDPGAFMDRSLLEGNPHSVIEGMIIGAYAIGSHEGFVYVRNEYPLAVETLTKAIEDCHELGMLGKDILGTGFDFDIEISRGGGAFVCGESTALMASLEGKRVNRGPSISIRSMPACTTNRPTSTT